MDRRGEYDFGELRDTLLCAAVLATWPIWFPAVLAWSSRPRWMSFSFWRREHGSRQD